MITSEPHDLGQRCHPRLEITDMLVEPVEEDTAGHLCQTTQMNAPL